MDVLGALVMEFFFARFRACKYQDTEWQSDSGEDTHLDGRSTRLGTDGPEEHGHVYTLEPRRKEDDRTAWGSYMERAPPILPAHTWIPGFEDELLLAARRQYNELNGYNSDEGDSEDEHHSSQDDGGKNERAGERLGDAFNAPTRRTRDISLRLPFSITFTFSSESSTWSSFLPTILSILSFHHHGNSSSLFGSTTRAATTTLRGSVQNSDNERTSRRHSNASRMAAKTHLWISLWFLLTAPVIFWDVGFCFMRPRSFKGGDLHWIWKPYEIYQNVDLVYGVEAYNRGDGFANAQSFLNVIETFLNLYYLYAQHILASPAAPLVGVATAVMTLSKTVLYWAQEYFCGGCAIGHNDFSTLFWFWIIPNGLWLIFPSLIIARLSRDIADGLTTASKVKAAKKD